MKEEIAAYLYVSMILIQTTLTCVFVYFWKNNKFNRCLKGVAEYMNTPGWLKMLCIWILISCVFMPYWWVMLHISGEVSIGLLVLAWVLYQYFVIFKRKIINEKVIFYLLHFLWQLIVIYILFLFYLGYYVEMELLKPYSYISIWGLVIYKVETIFVLNIIVAIMAIVLSAIWFSFPCLISVFNEFIIYLLKKRRYKGEEIS